MTLASRSELLGYVADIVEELERYAVTLMPTGPADTITLGQEPTGNLVIAIEGRFPAPRRSRHVDLELFERWQEIGADEWACIEYRYELRHHQIGYRRALHRHHEAHFVRMYGVATHEHCEVTVGVSPCGHYYGRPVMDAFDAFRRLYEIWLTDQPPDCGSMACLG